MPTSNAELFGFLFSQPSTHLYGDDVIHLSLSSIEVGRNVNIAIKLNTSEIDALIESLNRLKEIVESRSTEE